MFPPSPAKSSPISEASICCGGATRPAKRSSGSPKFQTLHWNERPLLTSRNSVWRPLYDDIKSWPLAVCDGSSVSAEDLIAVDQVRRNSRGEGYVLRYRPGLRWHYMSEMTRNEALLLKNFDTADVPAKCKLPNQLLCTPSKVADVGPHSCSTCCISDTQRT